MSTCPRRPACLSSAIPPKHVKPRGKLQPSGVVARAVTCATAARVEGGRHGRDQGELRAGIEALFAQQVEDLTATAEFRALEAGRAAPEQYDAFIENVARAHLRSPQLLAFLYALAPPAAADDLLHNLLEELGLAGRGGRPHPDLLKDLLAGAGLSHRLPHLEAQADEDLRRVVVEPLLYGSLREVGLAALTEIVAFEYMLSRVSGRFARALAEHRGAAGPRAHLVHPPLRGRRPPRRAGAGRPGGLRPLLRFRRPTKRSRSRRWRCARTCSRGVTFATS